MSFLCVRSISDGLEDWEDGARGSCGGCMLNSTVKNAVWLLPRGKGETQFIIKYTQEQVMDNTLGFPI